nr:peptidoglycan-binding domain-containing protein [Streptomyces sp. CRN 30]
MAAAAVLGFVAALLVTDRDDDERTLPAPVPTTPVAQDPTGQAADPDGPGTLREGYSGPEVTELQERLRQIPNVYEDGPTHGHYDAALTEAVARFQLWYGIRGDETGVYGDDTRRDLESRTAGTVDD